MFPCLHSIVFPFSAYLIHTKPATQDIFRFSKFNTIELRFSPSRRLAASFGLEKIDPEPEKQTMNRHTIILCLFFLIVASEILFALEFKDVRKHLKKAF